MTGSTLGSKALCLVAVLGILTGTSLAGALNEPTPVAQGTVDGQDIVYRDLRPDYVRDWHIFSDQNLQHGVTNGILDPGDVHIETFKNWWTTESAHTQHNHWPYDTAPFNLGPNDDRMSGPMNFAVDDPTKPDENYWLEREKNTVTFYLTHSQYDNIDWPTYGAGDNPSATDEALAARNKYANGWALGWSTHDHLNPDGSYTYNQTVSGRVKMDIFVHDGKVISQTQTLEGTYVDKHGVTQNTRSNPAVALSNDISIKAVDTVGADGQLQPPNYTDLVGGDAGYTWALNKQRFEANGLTEADFDAVVASMEVFETDPNALGAGDVIIADKRPSEIAANLVDGNGNAYEYQDAFLGRDPNDHSVGSPYAESSTDGGVLKGLAGYDYYESAGATANDWGEQQVIRIDIDTSAFETYDPDTNPEGGDIQKIVFWDFGASIPGAPGTQQTNPRKMEFLVDMSQTVAHGQIYYLLGDGSKLYFPENRIYIATVPEPATLTLIGIGAIAVLMRRRRNK